MLTTNRKGFKIAMPISDREIWGIGLVTYQWSALEHTIDNWTNVATGSAITRSAGQRASFKERANFLRETVTAKAVEPAKSDLTNLIDRAKAMQSERDKVVHWLWSQDELQRPGVLEWRNKGKWGTWKADYGKLRHIALKIDDISAGFWQLMLRYGKHPTKDYGLLSIAWQRICGIQNPTD